MRREELESQRTRIEHLKREVTGLIGALADYLVQAVNERVPFVLLDSERIAPLLGDLDQYAPYVVVVLLPEDAAVLDESYSRITDI